MSKYISWYKVIRKDNGAWAKDSDGNIVPLLPNKELAKQVAKNFNGSVFDSYIEFDVEEIRQPIKETDND